MRDLWQTNVMENEDMTSNRIGLWMALLGFGLGGACGSSPALSNDPDADVTPGDSPSDAGTVATGGTGGIGQTTGPGTVVTGGNAGGGGGGAGGSDSSSSDPDRKIASGTVALGQWAGASTTNCQQVLRLTDPAQPLTGYLQMGPSAYLHDSRAGEPTYVYLDGGKDAVILPGPAVTYAATSVDVSAAQLTTCVNEENACMKQDGYRVKVNERLSYVITIDDWEEEVALGQVELCLNNGALTTQFVFAGLGVYLGGGVAHDVTITPFLDGTAGTPTAPVTIECRTE
jgi:hypothetical protein